MLHGQRFDLGGLPLAGGLALELGPGFAAPVVVAVGLSRSVLGGGGRRGGGFAPGRRCRHGRTPRTRRGEGIGGHAARQCAGEVAVITHCCKREPREPGREPPDRGSPVMRPKTLLGSESHTGKTPRSLRNSNKTPDDQTKTYISKQVTSILLGKVRVSKPPFTSQSRDTHRQG